MLGYHRIEVCATVFAPLLVVVLGWTVCLFTAHHACAVDCNGIGVEDTTNIASGTSQGCSGDEISDEYQLEQWTQRSRVLASDAAGDEFFGYGVSISGDARTVGEATDDHAGGSGAGAAQVLVRCGRGWTGHARLSASEAATGPPAGRSRRRAVAGATPHGSPSAGVLQFSLDFCTMLPIP